MPLAAALDRPAAESLNDPLSLRVEGWIFGGKADCDLTSIEIRTGERVLGETSLRFDRPDVRKSLGLPASAHTGFAVLINAPELLGAAKVRLECHGRFRDGSAALVATVDVALIEHDHRQNHYGVLLNKDDARLFHRSDIYVSGPSQSHADSECLALLRRYLVPPGPVLDVGCGFGAYGRELRAAGFDWFGVEIKGSDCLELERLGLPHTQVDGRSLPLANGAFDSAITIEVLEHVPEPDAFLAEIRRVVRRRLLVSVPNMELVPYLHCYAAVPWHLLEGDHKNFFTRANLRHLLLQHFRHVEVLSYGPHPLRTPEGVPLEYHLFAICDV